MALGILVLTLITLSGLPADKVETGLFVASGLIRLAYALSARAGTARAPCALL